MELSSLAGRRAALVIAHPGHELRVHHWLELARPLVFVLTDGSGSGGASRLASTSTVLERAGARPGSIYGRFSDRRLYRALLHGEHALLCAVADELAAELDRAGIEYVVGDAAEGFNPGHDTCRLLLNAALHEGVDNYEFALEQAPDRCPPEVRDQAILLRLDDAALERKLAAARGYPEMAGEVAAALSRFGPSLFRSEGLLPVRYGLDLGGCFPAKPYYETYGEERVAAGVYSEVLRFRRHLEPLARALSAAVRPVVAPSA